MQNIHRIRNITEGKSASFAAVGSNVAAYHTPGTDIEGTVVKANEREIFIDSKLVSAIEIPDVDEAMNHFDYRSEYTSTCGRALAQAYDKQSIQVALLAAREATDYIGDACAARILKGAAMVTDKDTLRGSFFKAAEKWATLNVPDDQRYAVLLPTPYYLLAQDTVIFNRDYGMNTGSFANCVLPAIAGITPLMSNNVPVGVIAADADNDKNTYAGDYSNCIGVFHQGLATGTVRLMNLVTESEYSVRKQSTLIVSKFMLGHGILRPECAIEISKAA